MKTLFRFHNRFFSWELLLEPRDLWVGVYWDTCGFTHIRTDIYVCLLPCLPIHVWTYKHKED